MSDFPRDFGAGESFAYEPVLPNRWYRPRGSPGTATPIQNLCVASPFLTAGNFPIVAIACEVVVAGEAGSVVRMGICGELNGSPGVCLVDAGTVAADTLGVKIITLSQPLYARGLLYPWTVSQLCPITPPNLRATAGGSFEFKTPISAYGGGIPLPAASPTSYSAIVTGAFPAGSFFAGPAGFTTHAPCFFLRTGT